MISPNINLVEDTGFDSGTRALAAAPWSGLPIAKMDFDSLGSMSGLSIDKHSENWIKTSVFGQSLTSVMKGFAVSAIKTIAREKY